MLSYFFRAKLQVTAMAFVWREASLARPLLSLVMLPGLESRTQSDAKWLQKFDNCWKTWATDTTMNTDTAGGVSMSAHGISRATSGDTGSKTKALRYKGTMTRGAACV